MKEHYAGGTAVNSRTGGTSVAIDDSTQAQTAAYIEELVRELEGLAARQNMEPLRDLLRMAKEEARNIALGP